MPLYIKSPVVSQCNIPIPSVSKHQRSELTFPDSNDVRRNKGSQELGSELNPHQQFATVRCGGKKAMELLQKSQKTIHGPFTVGTGYVPNRRPRTARCQGQCPPQWPHSASNVALTKTKVPPVALRAFAFEPKPAEDEERVDQKIHSRLRQATESVPALRQSNAGDSNARVDFLDNTRSLQTLAEEEKLFLPAPSPLHSTNPFAKDKDPLQEAVALLEASAHTLFKKIDLHPETLKQIMDWQTTDVNSPLLDYDSILRLFNPDSTEAYKVDSTKTIETVNPGGCESGTKLSSTNRRQSLSSYFPNASSLPSRRAYKFKMESNMAVNEPEPRPSAVNSTPMFLLNIRESLSNISLVPMVSSLCPSLPTSTSSSERSEIPESEISDTEFTSKEGTEKQRPQIQNSVPVLRSKMKRIMRTLSDMNAVPEVMDIVIDNLPEVIKLSPDQRQRLDRVRPATQPVRKGDERNFTRPEEVQPNSTSVKYSSRTIVVSRNPNFRPQTNSEQEPPSKDLDENDLEEFPLNVQGDNELLNTEPSAPSMAPSKSIVSIYRSQKPAAAYGNSTDVESDLTPKLKARKHKSKKRNQ